jgi:drug/metabolite transporter (DMT)-like permease
MLRPESLALPPALAVVLLPLLTSLLFAGSFIAGKYTTSDLQPLTASLLRYLFALLFLLCVYALLIYRRKNPPAVSAGGFDLLLLALAGLLGIVAYHAFFFAALRYTAATNTAIINALNPIVTAFLATWLIRERLPFANYLGLVIAVAGVVILLIKGDPANLLALRFNFGDVLMLLAVVSWTLYTLVVKTLSARYSGFVITLYATLFGVLILLAPALIFEDAPRQLMQMSARSLWSLLYMGIAASGIGYLLYNLSIAGIGPTRTAALVYSGVPVFVALLALLLLGETLTPVLLISVVLILLGLNLVVRSRAS